MASIGLSKPYYAIYSNVGTAITYSSGASMGKAVSMDISLESTGDNVLYADNAPAESDNSFAGGTLKLTTDELSASVIKPMLGVTTEALGGTLTGNWNVYDDRQATPYVGFGAVAKKKVNGAVKYCAIVLPKVQFNNMNDAFVTQGNSIEWKTPEIEAKILRADGTHHCWKMVSDLLDTEAEAETAIKTFMSI